jgi:hypothetical protein
VIFILPMARQALFPEGTAEHLRNLMKQEKSAPLLRKIQAVYLGALHVPTPEIARITLYQEGYIRELWTRYRQQGEALFVNRKSTVRGRAFLSAQEEEAFLHPFFSAAQQGGILVVADMHQAFVKRVGHPVPRQTVYQLLHRHGWRKIVPRPYHPKRDSKQRQRWLAAFPPAGAEGQRQGGPERPFAPGWVSG